ncbi:hypothetical protein RM545_00120 [Zunongwangia sp. F260]|uniref:START domain-containing protein n=1 Tax=Autumnicola lenta TaxID=3075593 RepID=A0ABU3CFE6_9FLAO|nr:hypothetical protein [Zunongwangia sp. F260]MDT0645081.1 hypothetical protein [Zunongwangia sp. F260]
MSRDNICFILILNCFFIQGNSQNISTWEIKKVENEIEISYRWLTSTEGIKVREMKAEFFINANPPEIIEQFQNSEKLKKRQISKESIIKILGPEFWQTYLQFRLPWPFKSKDLITINKIIEGDKQFIIKSESSPNSISKKDNVNRIESLQSEWKLIPLNSGITQVVYTSISHDKPEFPRAVADPIIQDRLIKTLNLLKENAENEDTNSKD